MTFTIKSGRARGGPFNTKQIHHAENKFRIAFNSDKDPPEALPGAKLRPDNVDGVMFGDYVWQPALEEWWWDKRSITPCRETAKAVNNPKAEEAL